MYIYITDPIPKNRFNSHHECSSWENPTRNKNS